ncbi:MAG: hypothetical protein RL735_135 [Pseudomonadota bacterium]
MPARVLVVDDLLPNIRLLQARLTAEYYEVLTAQSGAEALAICARGGCDLVLLDVMMPGMDGFETCARIKAAPESAHIPVVMVTALDQPSDRVRGLEAGADDFLTKPVDELALMARVRSLSRLKTMLDDLRERAKTAAALGFPAHDPDGFAVDKGRILIVDDQPRSSARLVDSLGGRFETHVEAQSQEALFRAAQGLHELVVVSMGLAHFDPLRLCSQLRSLESTRDLPILMVADLDDRMRVLRGLDLGANDYILRPIDRNELLARVRTQIRRKFYADALRENVRASIELAMLDGLTGLFNRRHFDLNLPKLIESCLSRRRPLSLLVFDIDHFKAINDTHGHDVGDQVLRLLAQRLRGALRQSDLICRLGGEEFAVIMPDTDLDRAASVGNRVRLAIAEYPFAVGQGRGPIDVTISAGVAGAVEGLSPEMLYRRADAGLYRSKQAGRNRVCAAAA